MYTHVCMYVYMYIYVYTYLSLPPPRQKMYDPKAAVCAVALSLVRVYVCECVGSKVSFDMTFRSPL